jgi:predicted nucleotidyltransferase component of viral defense system
MNTISKCGVRFFLTGGTALSRAYYNHRYSDDLDFFVNDDDDYPAQVKEVFFKLKEDGFFWSPTVDFISNKNFTSFKVGWDKSKTLLKLDFVNDVASHFGDIIKTGLFDRTDSVTNMLSNKLTALFRFAAKDVADIREIALHEKVDWRLAINDARQKEAGLEIPIICDILKGMPQSEYETIAWTKKPSWEKFRNDIDRIVLEMISGESDNTI